MKIVCVYGNMSHYDHGLSELIERVKSVFGELQTETEMVDLGALHPPFYDGETTKGIDGVMEKLAAADGVIFACTAQMFAPTALMLSFLEYLENPEYHGVLNDKYCMFLMLSRAGGEKSALDYMDRVVSHYGGYIVVQAGLQICHLAALDGDTGKYLEKIAEDFFRAVHQQRKRIYIIPSDFAAGSKPQAAAVVAAEKPENTAPVGGTATEAEPARIEKVRTQLEAFSDTQEKEIEELSLLFSKKYSLPGGDDEPLLTDGAKVPDTLGGTKAAEAAKTVRPVPENPFAPTAKPAAEEGISPVEKLTQGLPEYFQPQLSAGLQAVIQLNITGRETFDGSLYIHSTECTYTPGTPPAPDIIIMADTAVWADVLEGKTTAQKAFMIGGIKVRGDFVLLTKFDTLFAFPGGESADG